MHPFQLRKASRLPRTVVLLLAIGGALLGIARPRADSFPADGEWPCRRRDPGLTSRAPGRARMASAPTWRRLHFVGARDDYLLADLQTDTAPSTLTVHAIPPAPDPVADPRYALSPAMNGQSVVVSWVGGNDTFARVLPDETTLQFIDFESGFELPTINGQWQPARVRCKKWSGGSWQTVWETRTFSGLFQSNAIAGDFDADGAVEIAFTPWSKIFVLDGETGDLESGVAITDGRAYGYFGVSDLDGNGKQEFIVLSDFSKHIDVCGYDAEGRLEVLWQRPIELTLVNPQRQMRVNPHGVADITGKDAKEIVVSLQNPPASAGTTTYDDGRWHVVVYEGMTGRVLADFVDEQLAGLVDLDGDGRREVLTAGTSGASVPRHGEIRVRGGEELGVLWSAPQAAWVLWNPQVRESIGHGVPTSERLVLGDGRGPLSFLTRGAEEWVEWNPGLDYQENSGATLGHVNILHRTVEGRGLVVIDRPATGDGANRLAVSRWNGNGFDELASVAGRHLQALAIAADGDLALRHTHPSDSATVGLNSAEASRFFETNRGVRTYGSPVAVGRDAGADRPVIVAPGAWEEEELVLFHPPWPGENADAAVELRRVSGRPQGDNWPNNYGPVLADLDGDGRRELLYAAAAREGGHGELVAEQLDGAPLWRAAFPGILGSAPVWNTGGITLWRVGHFRDPLRQDVLVTVRRNIMHSDETALLDGATGEQVWRLSQIPLNGRGAGGQPFALGDYDGDGLLEAASLYPDLFYILDGPDGATQVLKTVASLTGHPSNGSGYWGVPLAADFLNDGSTTVFHGTQRASLTGVIQPLVGASSARFTWADAVDVSPVSLPAFGDFDGDGRMEAIATGFPDGMRRYDTATGAVEWTGPQTETPNGVASADLDDDGRDEALFVFGSTVRCYGANGVEWSVSLPTSVGAPALADVAGAGLLSIVLPGADGWVYALDGPMELRSTVRLETPDPFAAEERRDPASLHIVREGSQAALAIPLTANLEWSGAAASGFDFEDIPTTAALPSGVERAVVSLVPRDDDLLEGPEVLTATLSTGNYLRDATSSAVHISLCDNERFAPEWSRFARFAPISFGGLPGDIAGPLLDFPLLVTLSPLEGLVDADGAADLRFSDATGAELPREIETWNPAGTSSAWVLLPRLESAATSVFMHWGSAAAAAEPPDPASSETVWRSGFEGVWHFDDASISDSTSHHRHGADHATAEAPESTARIGRARLFDGETSRVELPRDVFAAATESLTVSLWFRQEPYLMQDRMGLLGQAEAWGEEFSHGLDLTREIGDNRLRFGLSSDGSSLKLAAAADLPFQMWRHAVGCWDGQTMRLYLNGELASSARFGGPLFPSDRLPLVGADADASGAFCGFRGALDELRVARGARGTDWVRLEWLNQSGLLPEIGQALKTTPPGVGAPELVEVGPGHARVRTPLQSTGGDVGAAVTLFWGPEDGGTAMEAWANSAPLGVWPVGDVEFVIDGLEPGSTFFCRALAENVFGASWPPAALVFETPPPTAGARTGVHYH